MSDLLVNPEDRFSHNEAHLFVHTHTHTKGEVNTETDIKIKQQREPQYRDLFVSTALELSVINYWALVCLYIFRVARMSNLICKLPRRVSRVIMSPIEGFER